MAAPALETDVTTPLLTVPEVAQRLHISVSQTYSLLQQGTIPGFRIGKAWRIDRGVFAAWLEALARNPQEHDRG